METFATIVVTVLMGVAAVFVFGLIFAVIEMWLWNQVMPDLFGLKEITFWQAACISWLCGLWFKSAPSTKSE